MKSTILSCLCFAIVLLSCSNNPTEPEKFKSDLIIQNVTYSRTSGPLAGGIDCSLEIKNIGKGGFYGLLYIASSSEKYYQQNNEFEGCSLVYYDWSGNSIKPELISANQIINAQLSLIVPSDTNVIRFRIETDNAYLKSGVIPLPVYDESNYDNNVYKLTVQP